MARFTLLLAASLLITDLSAQTVRYVTSPFDSGTGTFRDIVGLALPGDTIRFQITGTIALTSANVSYNKDLVIEGPGMALLTISGNDLNVPLFITGGSTWVSGLTISNGNNRYGGTNSGGGIGFDGDTLVMTDVRVVDSHRTGINGTAKGGGVRIDGAKVRITDCIFEDNTALVNGNSSGSGYGGGLALFGSDIRMSDCVIMNNRARGSGNGGSVYGRGAGVLIDGTAFIENCTIDSNIVSASAYQTSQSDSYAYGAGVYIDNNSEVTFSDCSISGNRATGGAADQKHLRGAGLYAYNSIVRLHDCAMNGNYMDVPISVTGNFDKTEGGAIHTRDCTLSLVGTALDGNKAKDGSNIYFEISFSSGESISMERCRLLNGSGGNYVQPSVIVGEATALRLIDTEVSGNAGRGVYMTASDTLLVDRCLFSRNEGGLRLLNLNTNEHLILNTTFYRNYADEGAAILAENNTTLQLVNCTLVDDSLTSNATEGREIHLDNSTVLLKNTIIGETFFHGTDAFGGQNPAALSTGGNVCSDMSLSTVLTQSNDANNTNPQLGTFDNHGGLTKTWSLATGSTCIDRGGSDTLTVDQRRYFRDAMVDAGAYEFDGLSTAVQFAPIEPDLSIYPQPFSEQLTVQWADMDVQQINVLDLHGRTLHTFPVAQQRSQVLDLRSIPAGMYVVQLISHTQGSVAKRVMKVD